MKVEEVSFLLVKDETTHLQLSMGFLGGTPSFSWTLNLSYYRAFVFTGKLQYLLLNKIKIIRNPFHCLTFSRYSDFTAPLKDHISYPWCTIFTCYSTHFNLYLLSLYLCQDNLKLFLSFNYHLKADKPQNYISSSNFFWNFKNFISKWLLTEKRKC